MIYRLWLVATTLLFPAVATADGPVDAPRTKAVIAFADKEPGRIREKKPYEGLPLISKPPMPLPVDSIKKDHPRIYWHDDVLPRIAAAPAIMARMITFADSDSESGHVVLDRTVCCAVIHRVGLLRGHKYKYTREQYAARGVAGLLKQCEKPINLAGNHYAVNHLHPVAWGYDWLYDVMTEEQRATVRDVLAESLDAGYTPGRKRDDGKRKVPDPNLYWAGYNAHSGNGMTVALAIHGETETDWVRRYWDENWWTVPSPEAKGRGGYWNREYERDWLVGGGNNEDWGYLGNQVTILAARLAWETATGDTKSLDYPWLNTTSLLYMHQCVSVPTVNARGQVANRKLYILQSCCAGGGWASPGHAYWFAAGTGSRDPSIAAVSAFMLTQMTYAGQAACGEFFWRCLVGDPRVKPQSPAQLNLPLSYTTASTGFHYDRTGWEENATRVFFGCSEQPYRATASGDVMIWSKGYPLIAHRNSTFDHSYAGDGRLTLPQIREVKTGKLIPSLSGDGTPVRVKNASFTEKDGTYTADLSQLFGKCASKYVRTFHFDREANVVTITDEAVCAPEYVPTATWATPEKPEIDASRVLFSNGRATGEMTWDAKPAEVTLRGGETDDLWAEDYDHTLYHVEGTKTWRRLPRDRQIFAGGYYTVYVTPEEKDGVYRLKTTIRIK